MKFILVEDPVPKARHRTKLVGRRVITYDPQSNDKNRTKNLLRGIMKKKNYEIFDSGPLSISIFNYVPIPKSLSEKKKNELDGMPCDRRPDVDNYCKFYFDILNEVAYHDDGQITELYSKKIYSKTPRVEILLSKIGGIMINEHALTVASEGKVTLEQIDYLVKKANRLGMQQRQISHVFAQDDVEGQHIYFETDPIMPRSGGVDK